MKIPCLPSDPFNAFTYVLLRTFLDWEVINKDRHLKALSVYLEAAHAARLSKTFLFF